MASQTLIEIQELEKTFQTKNGTVHALKDINLQIQQGDIFGIIGMSGAGKSTLVRCMNLLERPTAGRVLFDGKDIAKLNDLQLRTVRRSMGMIFQQFNLLMQRTAESNICFPLEIAGVDKKTAKARAKELLELVGLPTAQNRTRRSFRAGRSSAWRLPVLWHRTRRCFCAMKPPVRWTPPQPLRFCLCSRTSISGWASPLSLSRTR